MTVVFLWTNAPCIHKVLSPSCPFRDLPAETALLTFLQDGGLLAELFRFSMFLVHQITTNSNSEAFNLLKLCLHTLDIGCEYVVLQVLRFCAYSLVKFELSV